MAFELFTIVAILLLIALIALGVPVFVAIGLSTIVLLQSGILPMSLFGQTLFSGLNSFPFIAIPLFILTGSIIVETGLSEQLLELTSALFGFLQTGIGTAVTVGCGLFATISGSNAADTAAIGRIALGPLNDIGYSRPYASALIASGSSTGILIPPSISYIIVGVVLGVSVSDLFKAAFIPGLLILGSVLLTNIFVNRKRNYESRSGDFNPASIPESFWKAKLALLVPFIILGGIYLGIFTPTESAVVAVLVTLIIGLGQDSLPVADILPMLEESALVNAMVSPIIAVSLVFGQVITVLGIPASIANMIAGSVTGYTPIILVLLTIFLIAGAVMELGPNILILGPLFLPLAERVGMSPIHYSVFMMSVFGIGFITPPIGLNLYVISGVGNEDVMEVGKEALPFVVAMVCTALFIAFFPSWVIWGV